MAMFTMTISTGDETKGIFKLNAINQHHKNAKIPSPGGRSVYTNNDRKVF